MLLNGKILLNHAKDNHYAIGAFNFNNLENVHSIVGAAAELNSPVLLQASQSAIKYAGIEFMTALVKTAADKYNVPITLHLDHGTDFNTIISCIRNGFTSVMIDASKYSIEENIEKTKEIVKIAHAVGVSVEAELGKIGGTEDEIHVDEKEATYTAVEDAVVFTEATGVDYLAIAVGTAHGPYKGEPKVDFQRIRDIRDKVSIPLVLHGSSGVPYDTLQEAIRCGICKINIDTDLRQAFASATRKFLAENPDVYDPRKILAAGTEAVKNVVKEKIEVFGSAGKAF